MCWGQQCSACIPNAFQEWLFALLRYGAQITIRCYGTYYSASFSAGFWGLLFGRLKGYYNCRLFGAYLGYQTPDLASVVPLGTRGWTIRDAVENRTDTRGQS